MPILRGLLAKLHKPRITPPTSRACNDRGLLIMYVGILIVLFNAALLSMAQLAVHQTKQTNRYIADIHTKTALNSATNLIDQLMRTVGPDITAGTIGVGWQYNNIEWQVGGPTPSTDHDRLLCNANRGACWFASYTTNYYPVTDQRGTQRYEERSQCAPADMERTGDKSLCIPHFEVSITVAALQLGNPPPFQGITEELELQQHQVFGNFFLRGHMGYTRQRQHTVGVARLKQSL